jgi:hypothetical protein
MRSLAAVIVVAIVGLALPAAAQDGLKASRGAVQAGKELVTHIGKTAAAKEKLNLSTPPAAPLFARVFDTRTLRALPPSGSADLPWLSDWLNTTATSYMAIVNFGTDPKSESYLQGVQANVESYEDEITTALDFMLRLFPRVMNSVNAYAQSLTEAERNQPQRQKGLANVRGGYVKSLSGAISFLGGGVKPGNARMAALVLRDTVQDWAAVATPEQRAEIKDLLAQAQTAVSDPQAQGDIAATLQTLAAVK